MSRKREPLTRRTWPQDPVRLSRGRRLSLSIAALFLLSLIHVHGMNRTLVLADRVKELHRACEALQRSVDRLGLEIAEDNRGGRVIELAGQRLGMVFPEGQTAVLAVLPAATRRGGSFWTYVENAFVMAAKSLQRHLGSSAQAGQAAVADSSGGP